MPRRPGGTDEFVPAGAPVEVRPVWAAFRSQVLRAPEATALIIGGVSLTYRELDHASAGLARLLWRHGLRPGRVVCVRTQQSALSVVAMLAALRTGATWAVLEPDLPVGRFEALCRDVDCAVVLSEGGDAVPASALAAMPAAPTVVDAADLRLTRLVEAGRELPTDPYPPVPEQSPAYVAYTSGSTGVPKGVMVSRGQLAASISCRGPVYGTEHSVFLIALRLSFDGILGGMFWSLTDGHTLVLPDPRQLMRVAEFTRLAREQRVTHLFNIPSYYRAVLQDPGGLPDTLRLVVVGGEACTPQLVGAHNERLPRTRFVNEYGPTETTIACTVEIDPDPTRDRVPIGRPWPGAQTLVLDERLREVPAGERGELYVGGSLVALGYANQPARTAERFVADPYGRPGGRLYRTGDIASVDERGALHYHGRTDDQAKIRGTRIELGEIESVLERHAGVQQAVVLCEPAGQDEPQVIAFVLPTPGGGPPDASKLREHCRGRLMEQATPTLFVPVDHMPLDRSTKVDRAALRTLIPADRQASGGTAGGDWSGHRLAVGRIWAEVLGHSGSDPDDNFFAVGGSSLKVIDLHDRLDKRWPEALRVGELFDYITIATQAQLIAERLGERTQDDDHAPPATYEL
ncbi:non-ribosomal peptide synthetase [Streptomyces sp. DH10]|uniref:non-ribosomal peptide synthetase n=1 Tax=Streptomyces sp. DH10 TaxID=3040121 RepID=UPI0024422A2C|nr:non-ribosomal peptide synthetase [Streptomyces sp. DH10]MDG9708930.1 non-ribosomal peptide synthetase [Streptomyces sp. DH10]